MDLFNRLRLIIDTQPVNGTISNIDQTTGAITYEPNQGFLGSDSFSYHVQDNDGALSNTATVTITEYNEPPNANNDTITTDEDSAVEIDVLANDNDSDGSLQPATVVIVGQPGNGSISSESRIVFHNRHARK
jgi:hypothetical protein